MTDVAVLDVAKAPAISPDGPADHYDNSHNEGAGGYITWCESCGGAFAIPTTLAQDAQHAALVILGEAE